MQSKWQKTTLGEFVNINPRRSVKKGTVTPFVGMPDIAENIRDIRIIGEREFGSGMKFQDGDTLFARITPCLENGKTVLVNGLGEGVIAHGSTEFIVLSPKDIEHDAKFIYYLARLPEFREFARSRMEGTSGRQRVDATALASYEFMLPPPDIRKGIGEALSAFDDKMIANSQMNQTLEKIAQRIFKSWFIDFDPVKANAEGVPFNGLSPEIQALFPSEFEESELGMIPKGWAINEISKCVDVGIGKTPPRNQHEWFELNKYSTNKKWFSIKDMGNNGLFAINSSEFLTDSSIEKFNIRLIPENAVILSFKLTLGRVSITTETCCTNEAIAHFVTDSSTSPITSEFLYFYLKNFNYGLLGSTSSIATAVNSKIIKAIPIFEASKEVMCKFTEVVSPFFEKIRMNSLQNNTLENIRSRILPRLLSGQVSLSDANQELKETE